MDFKAPWVLWLLKKWSQQQSGWFSQSYIVFFILFCFVFVFVFNHCLIGDPSCMQEFRVKCNRNCYDWSFEIQIFMYNAKRVNCQIYMKNFGTMIWFLRNAVKGIFEKMIFCPAYQWFSGKINITLNDQTAQNVGNMYNDLERVIAF